ncbi:Ferric uptake regulation protein [Aquimixticola soesokkakensis]|uniref:Ferric uptake regulation protein n=1 Tax=Aquimixticola soesokkakensis TaxID=1519096 RepID=A0A1Y5RZX2_9RHOB|nr:Fur family transcriptional regulator [Aquimixticola soesokkakensis]SLN28031.1 Ferric uptake regulation protein [Aquimixticola soesokkakensis]
MIDPPDQPHTLETLTAALRAAGIRVTRQRAALLRVLAQAVDHPDAPELQKRAEGDVPGISLSTVYRTLATLEAQGVVLRHQFDGTSARFEPAQSTESGHHDHMIDVDTSEVIEFCSDRIEQLQAEIAAELGYEIVHHRFELYVRKARARD